MRKGSDIQFFINIDVANGNDPIKGVLILDVR